MRNLPIRGPFLVLLIAGLWLCGCRKGEERQPPKNVVFILVDDLGHKDLGVTGSDYYETPNIDSIASGGMVFNYGYSGSRVCSPSRATLMTGKFTARHGITDWIGALTGEAWRTHERHNRMLPADYIHKLPSEEITIAETLQANGFKTFYAGKWHLGGVGSYPEDHGFQINKGGWEKGSPIGGYFSPWENPSLENLAPGENLSIRLAKETAAFIRENKDSSFFAVLSFYAVHSPIQTTREKWNKFRQKAADAVVRPTGFRMERVLPIREVQDNPIYGGLVETMDDAVGIVLEELKSQGLDKNTMVIFTSDNGGVSSGDNYSTSNLPLRGGKGYQWEGGLRVPLFIKVPGLQPGSSDIPATGADIYPTILDFLGLPLLPDQHLDGQSLKPIFSGTGQLDERALYWHYPHYGNQGGEPSSVIQHNKWKLIHYWEDGRSELYDLRSDIHEDHNILQEFTQTGTRLEGDLLKYLSQMKALYPEPDLLFDSKLSQNREEYLKTEFLQLLEDRRMEILSTDYLPDSTWWGSEPLLAD